MKVTKRGGSFIKRFGGAKETEIICFRFWQAVVAQGCPGACAYCFLQTSPAFVFNENYDLMGTLFENLRDIVPQVRAWLKQQRQPTGMIVGENQDGLAFEGPYMDLLKVTPLQLLVPLFKEENPHGHTLVVLSKYTSTRYAEEFGPSPNVVYSWSLSLPTISELYEKGVASLRARLNKAAEMKGAGYRVRLRLDALAPIPGWEDELRWVMGRINEIGPEMLTIGALRATNVTALRRAAAAHGRDASIFDYIETMDADGFKHRTADEFHTESFRQIAGLVSPNIQLGLCKEHLSMWQAADVRWGGCHCLHGEADAVIAPLVPLLGRTRRSTTADEIPRA